MAKGKQRQRRAKERTPERLLQDLQKAHDMEVVDIQYLRQPRFASDDAAKKSDYVLETFTTYGTYQDPV